MPDTPVTRKLSIRDLQAMRERGQPIAATSAYDYVTTRLAEAAALEMLIISDSGIATTLLGRASALQVSWDEVLFYVKAVARQAQHAFVVGSLPFGSYNVSDAEAVRNAAEFMKAGVDAIKIEGCGVAIERVAALAQAGIVTLAHLGATPHASARTGGSSAAAATAGEAAALLREASALAEAGAWALILEGVPDRVAEIIRRRTGLITLGAGGTTGCDGYFLPIHAILGMAGAATMSRPGRYAGLEARMIAAINAFCSEVDRLAFPTEKQTFTIPDDQFARFLALSASQSKGLDLAGKPVLSRSPEHSEGAVEGEGA